MNTKKAISIAVPTAIVAAVGAYFAANQMKPTIPKGVEAVKGFDVDKYLGQWYEIARFDFRWEKDLSMVTATYSKNDDGTIRVDNKGYNVIKDKWENSIGKAKFVGDPDVGMLKVSFFGPFYAGYNVVALDKDYRYVLVMGRNLDYLWLMSREKTMPKKVIDAYLEKASAAGYDLSRIVWTVQE